MNTPELVGECAYINNDYPKLFIPDRLWQTTLKKESKLNCKWLNYLLNTEIYRKTIKGLALKEYIQNSFLSILRKIFTMR